MKLTTKLVSVLVCGTILVLGIETYYSVRDEVQTFQADLRRDASQRALTLAALIQDVWARAAAAGAAIDRRCERTGSLGRAVGLAERRTGGSAAAKGIPEQLAEIRAGREVLFQKRDSSGHGFLYTYVPSSSAALGRARSNCLTRSTDWIGFGTNATIGAGAVGTLCWPVVASSSRCWEFPWWAAPGTVD